MNPQKVFEVYKAMIDQIPEDQGLTYEDIYLLTGGPNVLHVRSDRSRYSDDR